MPIADKAKVESTSRENVNDETVNVIYRETRKFYEETNDRKNFKE